MKQPDVDNVDCKNVEQVVLISPELIYDCKIQNSMNENEMNFQYIKVLDVEYLNSNLEFKEIVLGLKKLSADKSNSSEEQEKSSEGLILKE